jgi:hypothetical protein
MDFALALSGDECIMSDYSGIGGHSNEVVNMAGWGFPSVDGAFIRSRSEPLIPKKVVANSWSNAAPRRMPIYNEERVNADSD